MAYKDPNDPRIKEARRKWDQKNRRAVNQRVRAEMVAYLREYKESRGCADCGGKFPYYVLDLDHRSGTEKLYDPSRLVNMGSWVKLKVEVAKCDVVCANCHRERTQRRRAGEEF